MGRDAPSVSSLVLASVTGALTWDQVSSSQGREVLLSAALSSIGDFASVCDQRGRFVFANQPLLDLWGLTLEEAVGKNFFDLGYPSQLAEQLQRQVEEVLRTKKRVTGETPYTSPAGLAGHYESTFSPVFAAGGEVDFVAGSTRDITERKRVAEQLRISLEDHRALAEAMPQIVWTMRSDGWNTYFNQQWMDYTGLTLEESLGHGWNKAFHPEDQERARDAWQRAIETIGIYSLECRLRRADGVYRWWLIRGVPVRDPAGNLVRWLGTCTDIHDLKQAQLDIASSEERFATVFHSNLMALGIAERSSGRFVDVNRRAAEFFGYERGEMIGRTAYELALWADPGDRERLIADACRAGLRAPGEVTFRRKSGELRHGLVSTAFIRSAGVEEPLVVSGIIDISERKRLELQLQQAQKMEAIGRLAGGVAHDFNNALGVILGYGELLMRGASNAQRGKLEQILKAAQHAATLTRQLLAFSRKQVVEPKFIDLNFLVSDLEKMLGRLIGEDIDVAIAAGVDLGQVKADPGQLEQVVMNLCVNARDAMPDGGLLRVETANADYDVIPAVLRESLPPGRYVTLAVSDTGCGIEKEVLTQIFEPFFTTKELGKGTGLGLAMVYGIVKQAGGDVSVDSEPGRGSTFKIFLPRVDGYATSLEVDEAALPPKGWETILLVEDETALRELARDLLAGHGYRVIEAGSGDEAIGIAHRHSEPIHLLVTDVVMPGMNGRALAGQLAAVRPQLKVLYMSGYTDEVIAQRGVLDAGIHLVQKPFTVVSLLKHVREALGHVNKGEHV
jgi:two-component system cell cycle sensor histidine kinase/response regulator CckA